MDAGMGAVNYLALQRARQVIGIDIDAHHFGHPAGPFQIQRQRSANQPHAD